MLKGIDVSVWQGSINWSKVKAAGIDFAILKAGGSDDGFYTDSRFHENMLNAKAAGVKVGAYYFVGTGCTTTAAGEADAKRFLEIVKGYKFEYPLYIDVEVTPTGKRTGATDAAIAFCKTLEKAGYWAGIYGSTYSTFESRLDDSRLQGYAHWVAQYSSACEYSGKVGIGIWQYSSSGKVSGISGNVDMNYAYVDYPALIKAKGLNGYTASSSATTTTTTKKTTKYTKLKVDGVFGPVSIKALQTMLNAEMGASLDVDGVLGTQTYKALQMYINKWIGVQNN